MYKVIYHNAVCATKFQITRERGGLVIFISAPHSGGPGLESWSQQKFLHFLLYVTLCLPRYWEKKLKPASGKKIYHFVVVGI